LDSETVIQDFDHGTIVGASSPKAVLSKDSQSIMFLSCPQKLWDFHHGPSVLVVAGSPNAGQVGSGPIRSGQVRSVLVSSGQVTG